MKPHCNSQSQTFAPVFAARPEPATLSLRLYAARSARPRAARQAASRASRTGERLGGGFRWRGVGDEVVPWRSRLSGEKAVRELGYRPLVTYEEALAETERHLTESGLIKR